MKLFAKRALLLTIFVLCLFGISMLAASAETYTDDATAAEAGSCFRLGETEGGESGEVYFATLNDAVAKAASGDTIYMLADAEYTTNFVLNAKAITLTAIDKDLTLTTSVHMTLYGDASITIKDMSLSINNKFLDSYNATNGNAIALENVDVTINNPTKNNSTDSAAIRATAKVSSISIKGCSFTYVGTNTFRSIIFTNKAIPSLSVEDSTFDKARLLETYAAVGTASAPVTLTDVTSNIGMFYVYSGSLYADIFGGSYAGGFCYGGDNNAHTIVLRVNPEGNGETTFSNADYLARTNPTADQTATVTVYLRNAAVTPKSGATFVFYGGANNTATFTVEIDENVTFNGSTPLTSGKVAVTYTDDAAAIAGGYFFRLGATEGGEIGKVYFKTLNDAVAAAASGDTIYVLKNTALSATDITDKAISIVGSAKHTVTVASGASYAFKLLGTEASLTLSNLVIDVTQTGKNTNAYVFGVSKSTAGTFTLTLDNVDTKWKAGSGAIYGYGSVKADISITNCSFSGGTAIINTAAEATNVTMYLQNAGCVGSVIEVNSGATSRVTVTRPAAASYASDAEAVAAGVGFRLGDGEGGALGTKYFMSLNEAITAAQSGDTVYVLANAVFPGGAKISDKTLTIRGANADVVLTHFGGGLQLNGGVVSLTVKDLKINSYANFLDIYTSTDTHSVKLENVTVNSAAAANANFIYVSKTKANVEVVNCTFNSTNTIRLMTVSTGGNVTSYAITNTTLSNVAVIRGENSAIIGSAANPAVLTDLTSDKTVFYAYTCTIYANIYGGTFTGQFLYGGDGHDNTLDIKINPAGDKTTTFTLNTSGGYYGFSYLKPSTLDKNNVKLSFRNATVTDSGSAAQHVYVSAGDKARVVIGIGENVDFGGKTISNTSYVGVSFLSDAVAKTWGYDTVRIGAEGSGVYYTSFYSAYNNVVSGDTIYVLKNISASTMTTVTAGKKITITSAGTTPFTVNNADSSTSSILFDLYDGADITFTNIIFNVTNRFMRSATGTNTITFGAGATVTTNNGIFFYANGATAGNNTTVNINILAGSLIKATAATGSGLFYHNQNNDWDGDGTAENRLMNLNLVLAGTIEMVSGPIAKDHNGNGKYIVHYDTTTAKVTNGTTQWFNVAASYNAVFYAKGFASTEDAAAWGYSHAGATGMTYSADPSNEWNYSFFYHSQFLPAQVTALSGGHGGEVWQLRSAGSIYTTVKLTDLGTVTMKSYNGATITLQGEENTYRIQFTRTTVIMDGIELKAPGASVWLNPGSGATPTVLKMVNGAKITGTTSKSATLVKLSGSDTHLYVDSTSSLTQSGTTTSASAVVYADSSWKYSTIVIEGTISSTVTGNTECSLIKVDSTQTTYVVSVNVANFMDENGASTLGTTNLFLFPSGATPNLGLCTNDEAKVALIKAYTVSIGGVAQPAFDATKTVRGDFQHYYNTLAGGMLGVDDGGTVTMLKSIALAAQTHYLEYKSLTIEGVTGAETLTVPAKTNMFNVADNGHLTLKNLLITADVFVTFRQSASGASASVTLDSGAHVTNYDLAAFNDILIYNAGGANANLTVNIKAGASVIVKSLSEVPKVNDSTYAYATIYSSSGKGITVNVWGTLKNLAQFPDGKNGQIFVAKGSTNNAVLNIYDGAVIEGTSDSESYTGSYSGIVYFSEATNQINMYGGTVIIHGNTGFAYTGSHCTINISGGTIENRDGKYALFFGSNQTATVSGTDEKKPTFNVANKLLKEGVLNNAVNAFDESGYAAAGTLGFAVIYLENNNTAYTSFDQAWAAIPDGGTATLQFLAQVVSANITVANKHLTFIGKDNIVNDLAVSSSANADLYFNGTGGYVITLQDKATLTFRNMAVYAGRPLFIYTSTARTDLTQEESDITLNFENSWVSGGYASSVFMGGTAGSRVCDTFTINVDATSKLMFAPGVSSASDATMFYANYACFPNFVVNLHGTFEIEDKCTSTARRIWVFDVNAANSLTFNAFETAKIKFTCNEAQAAADHALFDAGKVTATIAAAAITDENGNSTLGDLYLYVADSNNVPNVCITHPTTALESTLTALKAKIGSELTPIALREQTAEGYNYYNTLAAAFNSVEAGGAGTFYVIQTMPVSATAVLTNRNITLVGADLEGAYHLNSTASYAFTVDNLGTLTFRDMKVTATAGLVLYRGAASGIAQADRDIYVNFENTTVDADGAATSLISSDAHHGDTSSTAANQKKQCDSITVTIDEDSEINFTTSATGEVKVIRYDHNTHAKVYTFIYGDVTVNATGDADTYFYLVRSNNPGTTQITVGEKANISITLAATRRTNGKSFFTSCTGGNASSNKLVLHASAITENGNLTLGGVKAYSGYTTSCIFDVLIIANDTSDEAVLLAWETLDGHEDTKAGTDTRRTYTFVKYRAMADGRYYYASHFDTALAKLDGMESTGGLYLWANASISKGFVLDGVDFALAAADGVTLTSSAARLFTLTNGASLTVENVAVTSTATTSSATTIGSFVTLNDATATAKCTVVLNNVTLTASGLPFYFGGASVADVTITGGDYTGVGMFAFGIALGEFGTTADVYFGGTVNLTVTGVADDHVLFTKTGGGDSGSLIFVNSATSVKDSVKVVFDYVDTNVSASYTFYLRNKGTLTLDYSNGTSTAANWFIAGQGSSVPYATFTNVDITGTSTDHIMRPYSGTAGAYIKFIGGSITANNVKGDNPVLNFNSAMDVSFDGVTFNSTSTKALIGGTATSYTMIDCIFNVTGPVLAKTSYTMIMKNSKIKESDNLVAVSVAKAAGMGFAIAVNDNAFYSSGLFATAMEDIEDGSTATVKFLAKITYAGLLTINNKNLTFVGKDSTVNDLTATSSANADLYFSTTSGGTYAITLQDKATLTFQNMAVFSHRPLFTYGTTNRDDLAKADRDITINLENSWLSGGSGSSVFMGGGGTSGTCDAFTINADVSSKLMFAPDSATDSVMFYANYTTFASFTVNLDGAIEVTDRCTSKARPIWMFNADTAVPLVFNVSETASIKFSCTEEQAAANHTIVDQSASVEVTIAAAAITDENGKSTLGDMDLYLTTTATVIPKIRITHTSNALETTLRALTANVASAEETPIQYLVVVGGVYNYFNSLEAATAFAQINGGTVQNLKQGVYVDVAAAVAGGMIYRYGDAVVNGSYGVHYFDQLAALVEYAKSQGATEIAVYVLTSDKGDGSTTTLSGVKLTLDSVDSTKQSVKMSGYPVFKLGENAHLVVKNVKILINSGFVDVVAKGETNTAKLDLETNAEIEAPNFTGGYFLYSESTALLTVNLKQGSSIKMQTNGTKTSARQGMFDFTSSGNIVAEGSSITIDGTVIYGLTFDANGSANARRAAMFKMGDKTLDLYFTEHADVQLLHVNAYAGTWNAIVCLDSTNAATVVSFNGGKYTTNENCNLIGLNGTNFNGTYTVTGNIDVSGVRDALVYDYATDSTDNTTVILFKDVNLGSAKLAKNNRLAYVQLENVIFANDAHAAENYGVKVQGFDNYYSLNKAVDLVADGGTITLLGNVIGARATITNKTLTIQGADPANPILITNSGNGSAYIFKCIGNAHLTLKNLRINAKGRAVSYEREPYTVVENDKEKTYYYDVTSSSLSLINTDIYGVAAGSSHNAMIYVGGGSGHHNFDLCIDATSSVGYVDGTPAEIKSTRNYQVILYNTSVTGDIVIEGEVYAYVYFQNDQVNYDLVRSSWTAYGPNAQYMISIGNSSAHTFAGNIVITETARLMHKVMFPETDQNGNRVYPEDHPSLHSAYAIRVFGGNAGVIVLEGATITTEYENEYQHNSAWVGFDGIGNAMDITYESKPATLHYFGVGALLATLNKTDYVSNKITVATASGSNYNIIYDNTTYVASPVPDDAEATDIPATDAAGYDYHGAWDIAKLLNTLTDRTDITAYADSTTVDREIVIGIANRDVVQTYLGQLKVNEFAIAFAGNKILVLAWNDAALAQAIESFKAALVLCTTGTTVTLPNVQSGTVYKFVANREWRDDFTKPADGTLIGGQYVDSNSLQYVYGGYADAVAGQKAFMDYGDVLMSQGYEIVWQNVIGNNMFRLYANTTSRLSLYVAYNDYEFKSTFYGTNGDDGLYGEEENDTTDIDPSNSWFYDSPDLNDEYFENRDHRKVLRVVSMPHNSVALPDAGINAPDFSYDKVTNTLQTTLSFQSTAVGLGHVYMLEDGRFLVIDGGGVGFTSEGDPTEWEAIYNVMVEMYTNVYGHAPTVEQPLHIAAWYLTHTHWDHVSAFNNFASTYGQDKKNSNGVVERPGIVLDYVIANVPVQQSVYKNAEVQFSSSDISNLILKFKGGNAKYIKVCTGQKLYLANLEIEVLMTFMDHAPFDIVNTNDTNTVTRFTIYNKLNDEDPADTLHSQSAQVLYLGDSWRHSSRILCEMYGGDANGNGNYLASDIVQLAHHGNIGCERILYKRIAPTAVYFSHNAPSFKSYVYFNNITNGNEGQKVAFRYAANVWCAKNAEYTWSAPYGTYNTLEFLAARPDYEGIKDLFTGVKLTDNSQYDESYKRTQSDSAKKSYIHNTGKATTSVNIVWGDLSFTYQDDGSTPGTWNAETHQYEGASAATREAGWIANGDNRIVVSNASTANTSVNVELKFTAASEHTNFTGSFTDNGTATIAVKSYKVFTFTLGTTTLPTKDITDQVIGNVTVTLK